MTKITQSSLSTTDEVRRSRLSGSGERV